MKEIPESIIQELAALSSKQETEIDFSDIPETSVSEWQNAPRGRFYKPIKRQLTVRIDADVLEWLKGQGKGYQSRLNSILRSAMFNSKHS